MKKKAILATIHVSMSKRAAKISQPRKILEPFIFSMKNKIMRKMFRLSKKEKRDKSPQRDKSPSIDKSLSKDKSFFQG